MLQFVHQIFVDKFHVDKLINTGIAGSLDAAIDIGDIVISTDMVQHDVDASTFGRSGRTSAKYGCVFLFPADKELIEKAVEANTEANPDIHNIYLDGLSVEISLYLTMQLKKDLCLSLERSVRR